MPVIRLALFLLLASAVPAHAYIDAGSGSYMFQVLLAGLFALVFSAKTLCRRAVDLVTRRTRKQSSSDMRGKV